LPQQHCLIGEREKEIEAFNAEEYWNLQATSLIPSKSPGFILKLARIKGIKAKLSNAVEAKTVKTDLEGLDAKVSNVTKKKRNRNPGPPFITSKLQQDAARAFRYTAKRTMRIAQSLYEGIELGDEGMAGLITYMRTDSTRVSNDALEGVRQFITESYGPDFLPEKANVFKTKKSAQEAHEAIRPTSMRFKPSFVKAFLKPEQFKLYQLIWYPTIRSKMRRACCASNK